MRILTQEETTKTLSKLFAKLNRNNLRTIKNYVERKPKKFLIITFNTPILPNLWYPQKKGEKYITQVYEKAIQFNTHADTASDKNQFYQELIPNLSAFLEKEKQNEIITVGEWFKEDLMGKALLISPSELKEQSELLCIEGYFFPKDLSWLFSLTHEGFAFLAGNSDFIDQFTQSFPNYKKHLLDYDMLGPHNN